MIFRSWPAVIWLIKMDAITSSTPKPTMVSGTRSRTDSRNTASATSRIVLIS